MNSGNFLAELKRRNVYKVAAPYIVGGWALSQGIAQVLPVFDVPNWIIRLIVVLIIADLDKNRLYLAHGSGLVVHDIATGKSKELAVGVPNALTDPVLELHGPTGFTTIVNDNWGDASNANEIPNGFQPSDSRESVIITTLTVGPNGFSNYSAIVRGANGETGIGLAEAYDLEPGTSQFANISTRGFVDSGDNIMIGGFILDGSSQNSKIVIRAVGPSLTNFGITNALANPKLELHDGNGATIKINGDWKIDDATGQSQEAAIRATTLQPSNDFESTIPATLAPGPYTAIVAGKNNTTGVGLVEVYNLQ